MSIAYIVPDDALTAVGVETESVSVNTIELLTSARDVWLTAMIIGLLG
jgi:hypothetical protein